MIWLPPTATHEKEAIVRRAAAYAPVFGRQDVAERAVLLERLAAVLAANRDRYARLVTEEMGNRS